MAPAKNGKAKDAAAAGDARIIDAAAAPGGGKDLLALFMRHSPIYTYIKEVTPTESRVLQASDNFQQMIGIPGPDMLGKTMAELFPPEFAAKITADDWAVVSNGKVLKLDEDLNGRHYITIKFPIVQGGKNLLAGYTIDITQQKQAEEALREREETYRALVAGLPDVVSRFDREGRHLFISGNIRETGDFDAAHMTGKTHRELGYPEAQCRFWEQAITQVFDRGLPFETEYAFIGRKGPATHNWRLMPERDAQGVVRSVLSISRDITVHRQVEQDYHMLFKQMLNGFALHKIICDPQGRPIDYRYLAVNPAFERMTGLKAKDLVGRTVREALPGIEQHWIDTYGKVALTGEPAFFEKYSADLKKYFEVTAFRPAANQFACIFADITERKRAEEDLKRQTSLQQLLIQISSAYINQPLEAVKAAVHASLRDMAVFVGADRAYIFDYDFQRQICTNTYEWCGAGIEPQIENQQAMPLAEIPQWVAAHRAGISIYVPDVSALPSSKGREILEAQDIKSQLAVPFMHAGECIGFIGFDSVKQHHAYPDHEQRLLSVFAEMLVHVRLRKRAEAEKDRLEEQLQQAQKMESVGRLAGGVAHDFNNMLGVILGHADLALEQMAAEHPVHADLAEIRKAAGRSADLTRQLLAFARKQTIAPKVLDLNETVEGMLNMLRRLIGEDIQLNWRPGAELWPAKVDSSQIDQILTNLCVNARDAIAGVGQITIETGNTAFDAAYCADHAELAPGDYVRLSVSDSGCGMDKETLSHLFEPFFTTKGVGRGTGLGLATVYGAVKQNNGFISTCSEPGQGTMITIHLPRHAEKGGQAQKEAPVQPDVRGRETILLAEDEPSILKLTTKMLEKLGYTVLAASTPGEAIRLAREHTGNVHLLITDVVMPEMNGRDLAKNVLSIYPDIRRLFMSGYTADVIAHHGVLDEGVYFIQKPFAMKELAAKVRETLDAG
jgi:PAS domain S-box-containing protein